MRVGIAADHTGVEARKALARHLGQLGHEIVDFGATVVDPDDDYPDLVAPLAEAVARGAVERGVALCGSGVGACIAANKIPGVRACVCHDAYSARQGVEHDDMNLLVLGARVIAPEFMSELTRLFLDARFTGAERHRRRLHKIRQLERRYAAASAPNSKVAA